MHFIHETERRNMHRYFLFVFPGEFEVGSTPFAGQDDHHGDLHIRGVREVDAGRYTCVASSPAGTATGTVILKVGGEFALQRAHTKLTLPYKCIQRKIFSSFHSGPIVL